MKEPTRWSVTQYARYEDERTRPVRDLVAAIPTSDPVAIVDLGCGPGNSTEVLCSRFPGATVVALDSSLEMCEAARHRLPHVRVDHASIETWSDPGPWDVIHANAVLQWVDGHARLLPHLVGLISSGGSLAIQMPDNLGEPAQILMRTIGSQARWSTRLADAAGTRTNIKDAAWYFDLLRPLCARVDVWRTTYHHHLVNGVDGIIEWFKGSGLRPFLQPLDAGDQADFLALYRQELVSAYPTMADGSVLLPFPRLFIVATR